MLAGSLIISFLCHLQGAITIISITVSEIIAQRILKMPDGSLVAEHELYGIKVDQNQLQGAVGRINPLQMCMKDVRSELKKRRREQKNTKKKEKEAKDPKKQTQIELKQAEMLALGVPIKKKRI